MKRGKKYLEAAKLVEPTKEYQPQEAVELAKKTAYGKFNQTIEAHFKTGLDVKQAEQQVRGVVLLPHGTGKTVRILVFAEGDGARLASEAGADYVGADDLIKQIEGGWTDFDVAIATPQLMGKVGRLGKVLGPRGLMPSPKAGTIVPSDQLPQLIKETRLGRVEFKTDKTGGIHSVIGKSGFTEQQLMDNFSALMDALQRAKPSGAKGVYLKKITLAATMGPGVHVDVNAAQNLRPVAA
ncbi:MAG TPA: 50S ribosomal protein L1 [Anaerolineae bacterium]|nr:50S ribosomal protein L1 [Anaerolineae bacterium]